MADTISNELKDFKTKLDGKIPGLQSAISQINDKIESLKTACTSTKSSIASVYDSSNKDTLINKLSTINDVYDSVGEGLSALNDIVSKSGSLVDKVTELENKLVEVNSASANMNNNKESENYYSYVIKYNALRSEFVRMNSDATALLSEIKSMDGEISLKDKFGTNSISDVTEMLSYGTFNKKYFDSSYGKVEYYLYVPDVDDTTGLPMMVYLHGTGERGNGVLNQGLPKQIYEKSVVPNGLVICVQGKASFGSASVFNGIAELTESVANEYKVDKKRISASGHSDGAIGAYKLVANHTDLFSALIPISGCCYDKFPQMIADGDVKVWSFHGNSDSSVKYANGKGSVDAINKNGGDAELCTLNDGHCIQNKVFGTKYDYKGEEIDPLDWAFNQRKA